MACANCGEESIYAKGWCARCYSRQLRTGSLEYSRKFIKPSDTCVADECYKKVVAKGLCDKHYRLSKKYGDTVSPFLYGHRRKHQLYGVWVYQRRVKEGRVIEWDDFWVFVNDVGDRPGSNFVARRPHVGLPWGPANFCWQERIPCGANKSAIAQQWREQNPLKAKSFMLKRAYGIDITEYLRMYDEQQGKCKICGDERAAYAEGELGKSQTLVVDHCHNTGKIRGLLCAKCNKALGGFKDSVTILLAAVEYLTPSQDTATLE